MSFHQTNLRLGTHFYNFAKQKIIFKILYSRPYGRVYLNKNHNFGIFRTRLVWLILRLSRPYSIVPTIKIPPALENFLLYYKLAYLILNYNFDIFFQYDEYHQQPLDSAPNTLKHPLHCKAEQTLTRLLQASSSISLKQ